MLSELSFGYLGIELLSQELALTYPMRTASSGNPGTVGNREEHLTTSR